MLSNLISLYHRYSRIMVKIKEKMIEESNNKE